MMAVVFKLHLLCIWKIQPQIVTVFGSDDNPALPKNK